jgi:cathepsin A (carboxypeptidase C)
MTNNCNHLLGETVTSIPIDDINMALGKVLVAGLAIIGVTAQLKIRPASLVKHREPASSVFRAGGIADGQHPMGIGNLATNADLPPYKAGQYTLVEQSNQTCATYGERQWTGTVDVTDEHRLFFWFFDSRNDPENDPVVIWLNGGPGGSSMMGLFDECGACWLDPNNSEQTVPNAWAWNNNASMLFLDQPAGVGFSSLAEGAAIPQFDIDAAEDFQVFLNTFFSQIFPERASLPIHLAAESYGGHYAPTYVNHILETRRYGGKGAFRGNITSLILVDALLDWAPLAVGSYELLCSHYHGENILNETACEAMRLHLPEVEALGQRCDLSRDERECYAMIDFTFFHVFNWYFDEMEKGARNPYNGTSKSDPEQE